MAVLAGIDEAGYGPLLGPLVVSSVVLEVPDELLKADLWHLLEDAVTKTKKHAKGRLLITDSKKAYSKSSGIRQLQRTVLAALANLPHTHPDGISTAAELIETVCPACKNRLAEYSWYKDMAHVSLNDHAEDTHLAASVLSQSLRHHDIRLFNVSSYCLDAGHYNQMVKKVNNKASVLFTAVCTLINHIMNATYETPEQAKNLHILIDRHGGRSYYLELLQKMFPSLEFKVLKQNDTISSYRLSSWSKTVNVHFVLKADDHYLPVSLASMVSKYLREVLIEMLNAYFVSHYNDLKPTAGYWQDGQRFVREIREFLPHVKYDMDRLVRMK